jgi:CheY-like chemotaxis protein
MTILLVNNNRDEVGVFGEALQRVDPSIAFEFANDGADAYRFLTQNPDRLPGLIVVDETGFPFLEKVRRNSNFTNIPVTVYTTSTNPDDIDASIAYGASFLPKPNSYFTLVKLLKKRLARLKELAAEGKS